jgi:HAD superfamily hydrolase (TIGR01509 family)
MESVGIRKRGRMTEYSDIGAVVLDIDGTLCSLTQGVGTIYHELLLAQGLESDANALESSARREWAAFRDTYLNVTHGYQTTHERERAVWLEFVRRVCDGANLPYGGDAVVVESIYNAFASQAYRSVEPGAIEFLRQGRDRGLKMVAASNNDIRSKVTLKELGLDPYLSDVVVAGDLGWKKPSPQFYANLARRVGVEPSKILHVGNDLALDVDAARHNGFVAVLYSPRERGVDRSVTSFAELGDLVGL